MTAQPINADGIASSNLSRGSRPLPLPSTPASSDLGLREAASSMADMSSWGMAESRRLYETQMAFQRQMVDAWLRHTRIANEGALRIMFGMAKQSWTGLSARQPGEGATPQQ